VVDILRTERVALQMEEEEEYGFGMRGRLLSRTHHRGEGEATFTVINIIIHNHFTSFHFTSSPTIVL